jgi:hypothetical protein
MQRHQPGATGFGKHWALEVPSFDAAELGSAGDNPADDPACRFPRLARI